MWLINWIGATQKPLVICLVGVFLFVILELCLREMDTPLPPTANDAALPGLPASWSLRSFAKSQLAADAGAGRISLFEAAALFGALNQLPPQGVRLSLLDAYATPEEIPAHTEEERLCQQVIRFLNCGPKTEPAQVASAMARLEAEFWEERRRHGSIRLPDPRTLVPVQELLERALRENPQETPQVPNNFSPAESMGR